MGFNGYLSNSEIMQLVKSSQDGGLIGGIPRAIQLAGIPRTFASSLNTDPSPLNQFMLDLNAVNQVERMADGDVPVVTYLENAASQLRLRQRGEAAAFEKILSRLRQKVAGVRDLPAAATLTEVVRREAIVGTDDMVDVVFLASGQAVANAVARILVPRFEGGTQVMAGDGSPWVMNGTAWLVAPGVAITNRHVIMARRDDEPEAAAADFDLQGRHATLEFGFDDPLSTVERVAAVRVLAQSAPLDYALVELTAAVPRPVPRLARDRLTHDATSRTAVNIIQHPRGAAKRIAFRNNLVTAADTDHIRYFTDTDRGSSGSPVCDDRWRVVALHRGAQYTEDVLYQGRDSAYVNFGSQIAAVMDDLRTQAPAIATAIATEQGW